MIWKTKAFEELTTGELYEILRLRAEIFVVEQNCPYQDLDGIDYRSLHLFCEEAGEVLACLRVFVKEEGTAVIGRVVTKTHGMGLGGQLLKRGIQLAMDAYQPARIVLGAQLQASGYYAKQGFTIASEPFLEDGIWHVRMVLDCRDGKEKKAAEAAYS